jgi:hypothetical protein
LSNDVKNNNWKIEMGENSSVSLIRNQNFSVKLRLLTLIVVFQEGIKGFLKSHIFSTKAMEEKSKSAVPKFFFRPSA